MKELRTGDWSMSSHYTDNTNAENPPGGKQHKPSPHANVLPSDLWRAVPASKKQQKRTGDAAGS
jgi:hypothetical protein